MNRLPGANRGRLGLDRVVEVARRQLPLDVVYVAEFRGGRQVYRAVAGDAASFNIVLGQGPELEDTYCQRLVAGEIPNVICDAAADERVAHLPITLKSKIGAYVGVTLRLPDGTLYGTICCVGHAADPTVDERAVQLLATLGELIVDDLDELRQREGLRQQLARLIESERINVAYQPILDLGTDRVLGIEALARFPDPFGKPHETFAAAESVGLGVELERLVIRRAWEMLPRLGVGQFLAVNVSPSALLDLAVRANRRDDLPLASLVVEVTEHCAVEAYSVLRRQLAPLRRRGLRIAVDDAGAGYASLRHVLELRPDFIKLDRWLIHGLEDDCARRVAVSAFGALARELGSKVVAEGVEHPGDLRVVRELGLDAAQGYLLGRPTTDQEAAAHWCEAHHTIESPTSAAGGASDVGWPLGSDRGGTSARGHDQESGGPPDREARSRNGSA
jgi:EAL domain-containing protein (putative c-di-GMP-specific phosphodiesterase class I)